jgi:hypothetical protein
MLIVLRRASASRCRTQVTSNVRHPKAKVQMQCNTRASERLYLRTCRAPFKCKLEAARSQQGAAPHDIEARNCPRRRRALQGIPGSVLALRRTASQAPSSRVFQFVGPAAVERKSSFGSGHWSAGKAKTGNAGFPSFRHGSSCGSIQDMVATLSLIAGMPNPSVNLTRNSAPRWPSEARYAHNAPLVHRVTLSHSGYLKR